MKNKLLADRFLRVLARAGMSNPDIANELGLTMKSTLSYWGTIRWKLGVKSRAAALAKALKMGLITIRDLKY